ncbi:TPA: glycosyltransferase family 2 protein [Enterobacter cloacae]
MPIVSIIMPSYNSALTIRESIESVQRQSLIDWELLITDDHSNDETRTIIKQYQKKDSRIKFFVLDSNGGAGVARNNSIEKAKGRFIAFLDSDDVWHKNKLEKQIDFMIENGYALTYTAYQKIDIDGCKGGVIQPPLNVNYEELLKSNVIGCLTAIYDTQLVGKVYMPHIRKRQDMALWLLILKKIDFAWCLNEVLAYYREGHASLSSNKIKVLSSQWYFYRKYLMLNVFSSTYYFVHYVFRAFYKHRRAK